MSKIYFFEGPIFSGKTTLINRLSKDLEDMGFSVLTLKEPGGSFFGEKIRDILVNKDYYENNEMQHPTRRLLFAASHQELIDEIDKNKNKYDYILIDRYMPISDFVTGVRSEFSHKDKLSINRYYSALNNLRSICSIFDTEPIKDAEIIVLSIDKATMDKRMQKRGFAENKIGDSTPENEREVIRKSYENLVQDIKVKGVTSDYTSLISVSRIMSADVSDTKYESTYSKIKDTLLSNKTRKGLKGVSMLEVNKEWR